MTIADIIKYEGDNSTFIWKHPCEDFNTGTQLIVHESQEAIFFMNGQALDAFGAGRHTLTTQNIPLLGKALNKNTDGKTPFHCEVYFINKTVQMSIKWGTDSKVRFLEPTYGIPIEIGACGEMNLMVANSRKLLLKLVGTMNGIAWGERGNGFTKSLSESFRPLISTAIKAQLPVCIKNESIDIFEIDEHLASLSEVLRRNINKGFEEYGLTIPEFYITGFLLPENDPSFRRMREMHTISLQTKVAQAEAMVRAAQIESDTMVKTAQAESDAAVTAARRQAELERQATETEIAKREAERELIKAQTEAKSATLAGMAEAEVMRAKGYTEKDVLQAEVQKAYAEGIGSMNISGTGGGVAGDMIGLSMGMAAAGAINSQMADMFTPMASPAQAPAKAQTATVICAKCGKELPEGSKFCLECGTKIEILSENEIICPSCGNKTPKGKFCMECGASLVSKCAKCGAELPTGAKFCLECGEKL